MPVMATSHCENSAKKETDSLQPSQGLDDSRLVVKVKCEKRARSFFSQLQDAPVLTIMFNCKMTIQPGVSCSMVR